MDSDQVRLAVQLMGKLKDAIASATTGGRMPREDSEFVDRLAAIFAHTGTPNRVSAITGISVRRLYIMRKNPEQKKRKRRSDAAGEEVCVCANYSAHTLFAYTCVLTYVFVCACMYVLIRNLECYPNGLSRTAEEALTKPT